MTEPETINCRECDSELEVTTEGGTRFVEPCATCMETAVKAWRLSMRPYTGFTEERNASIARKVLAIREEYAERKTA